MLTAGAVVGCAGFSPKGGTVTGRMNHATMDSAAALGPLPSGTDDTTAVIVGPGFTSELFTIGAQYYYVSFDAADPGGTLHGPGRVSGGGLGAGSVVGPGVTLERDVAGNPCQAPGVWDGARNGGIVGVGARVSWLSVAATHGIGATVLSQWCARRRHRVSRSLRLAASLLWCLAALVHPRAHRSVRSNANKADSPCSAGGAGDGRRS
jgi:hypothetical protein